jgi:hypothetical protein
MSDQATRASRLYREVYLPAYAEIAPALGIPRSDTADRMLLAIAGQEADFRHRYQVLNSGAKGPARGLWQFERMGGVEGVLTHERTRAKAIALCEQRGIPPRRDEVWPALEFDDALALGFARLLLWSDPRPLPNGPNAAWEYYLRNWRPGKPHPDRWPGNWSAATAAVMDTDQTTPSTEAQEYPTTDGLEVHEMADTSEGCDIIINRYGPGWSQEITIPNPDFGSSAVANAWQLAVLRAIADVGERFGRAKAAQAGEPWPEV